MRRGLFLAPFDELADARLLGELGALAEERGWDGLFLWDHVQYVAPVERIAEVWISLTAIAMRTQRLRIGPMVTPLARRRPWVLARQAVTLDRLSGGRVVLGLGVGGDGNGEMGPLGEEPQMRIRAQMLEEGLELLEAIFSGEPVQHAGRHYTLTARPFLPRSAQSPRIPIWLGAVWPGGRAIDRAARWDGVFPLGIRAADLPALGAQISGRRPAAAGPLTTVAMSLPGEDPGPWDRAGLDWLLTQLGPRPCSDGGLAPTPPLAEVRAVIEEGPGRAP
jgi:alkanesulfonate monooxygenase SsuD/methylene tetrahydromethanopterin reductase-like flavin-dependent oxidoreductase (luciferase family)